MDWQSGQRVRGKNYYSGKRGTVVSIDGVVERPSEVNPGGKKVYVKWDDDPDSLPDNVEDSNLERI